MLDILLILSSRTFVHCTSGIYVDLPWICPACPVHQDVCTVSLSMPSLWTYPGLVQHVGHLVDPIQQDVHLTLHVLPFPLGFGHASLCAKVNFLTVHSVKQNPSQCVCFCDIFLFQANGSDSILHSSELTF
jgi:hypothetical protein